MGEKLKNPEMYCNKKGYGFREKGYVKLRNLYETEEIG